MRGDLSRAAPNAAELAQLAHEHDLPLWRACGVFFEGAAKAESGAPAGGLEAHASRRRTSARTERPRLRRAHQDCARRGRSPLWRCRTRTRHPRRSAGDVRTDWPSHVRSGTSSRSRRVLLKRDPANHAPAEAAFRPRYRNRSRQGTRSFALRAALSLAKLYQSTARPADAHAALAPALEGFSATPEMPEIAEAQALLASLQRPTRSRPPQRIGSD